MKAYYYGGVVSDLHFGPMNLMHTFVVPGKVVIRFGRDWYGIATDPNAILMELHNNIYADDQIGNKLHEGRFEYDLPADEIDKVIRLAKEYAQAKERFNEGGRGLLKIIGHENDDEEFAERLHSQFEKRQAEQARLLEAVRRRTPSQGAKARAHR